MSLSAWEQRQSRWNRLHLCVVLLWSMALLLERFVTERGTLLIQNVLIPLSFLTAGGWMFRRREKAGADSAGCAHYNVTPDGERRTELLLPAGIYEETGIREKILWPLAGDRLQPPVFNGFIWRFLFDAAILRDNAITFEGAYLEDELFLMEYFANVHRLAVTDKPLYRYLENPASATHRYMRDYPAVFARFLERKAEIVEKYGLDAARPQWRANTVWAGLLIAVGNEYVKSNPKPVREKRKAVEALCAQPEFAKAIRELRPKGLGRNKQIVADLIGSGRFGTLTALYRLKNHM